MHGHVYRPVLRRVDMHTGMCIDMCVDMRANMCMEMIKDDVHEAHLLQQIQRGCRVLLLLPLIEVIQYSSSLIGH